MGLTREQFAILTKGMKAAYTQQNFIQDKDSFNVWYEMLKDLDYDILNSAIQKHIMTSKYPPTIAELRESSMSFRPQGRKLSELEAWGMVRKAIRNSIYHSEEEFDKLPKTVQAAVGSHTNLREWAQMDTDTVESVEASHFVRNFRVAQERENEMTALPENIREQLNIAMHGVNGAIQHGSYENAIKKLDCEVPREGKE